MEIGILALQGDVAEHDAALAELGVRVRPVRTPEQLRGLDGLVLPGGESTTMSMLLESSGLVEPLAKELAAGLPVLGTCAGMILLAAEVVDGRSDQRAFGLVDMSVRRNGFGRQLDSFECELTVDVLGEEPLHAVFIRAPKVERVGPEVEVLATVGGDGVPGDGRTPVLCRQGSALVAAFHPELTADGRVHRLFCHMIEQGGR